jgi:aromatic amino acid aminotransferase I
MLHKNNLQTLITQLIVKEWGVDGYITWLKGKPPSGKGFAELTSGEGLRQDYISRRDSMTDLFVKRFSLTREFNAESGSDVYVGWKKVGKYNDFLEEKRRPLVSLRPPEAGMFIWVSRHFFSPIFQLIEILVRSAY